MFLDLYALYGVRHRLNLAGVQSFEPTCLRAPACAEGRHAARGIVGGWGGYPGYPIRPFILSYVDG
jgi:hypothetical protein